ncbi:MAG: 4Fe-4S binding protein [Candidatus Gastranaerophilales bacterium]|nr:4Fe-4S binding protein [Candidatus Gastranaerophilales bacterium]
MLETIKCAKLQKNQVIKDIKSATIKEKFRGLPKVDAKNCTNCNECQNICPTNAIGQDLSIDLGKCIFCGDCERVCCSEVIKFTNFHKIGSSSRENLITKGELDPIQTTDFIKKTFGRSLKLRQVSAGGCNSCEMELNACSNANFDMGRFGIEFVASPRHADGIVITGPITQNMAKALQDTYQAMAEPKIVILVGACAISGGIFQNSEELNREFLKKYNVDLYIPGCPAHPLTIINALLDFLQSK